MVGEGSERWWESESLLLEVMQMVIFVNLKIIGRAIHPLGALSRGGAERCERDIFDDGRATPQGDGYSLWRRYAL